jgi:hypothetical protein
VGQKKTTFDAARDQLFSEMHRCGVLEASPEDAEHWLDDTIEYLAGVYGTLDREELQELQEIGARFARKPIPHGRGKTALNREDWQAQTRTQDA